MIHTRLIIRYMGFAVLATLANLTTQRLVLLTGDAPSIYAAALAAGTLVGLVLKYLLDKRWIFNEPARGLRADAQQFTAYTTMGLVTTAIFWGVETAFWWIWGTDLMREIGAILGLSVGYIAKFFLDRHYVFTQSHLSRATRL